MKKNNIVDITNVIPSGELLEFVMRHDNIDVAGIRNEYDNMKRENYLEQHNHKVWQAKDGKWKTYLDDENKPRGFVLKVRTTEKAIEDLIVQYYKDKELDPYIEQVFEGWNEQRLQCEEISIQSYNRYANDFKRFFPKNCILRQKKFRLITEDDLETFIKMTIHEKKLTNKSYSGLRTIIRGIFKYGKSKHFTNISITTFLGDLDLSRRVFTRKVVDKESEVFSENEISIVESYLRKRGTIRDLGLLLSFKTGVRVGELSALKKEDIVINRKCIHIQRTEVTYKDPKSKQRICEVRDFPKTEAGDRYLIIPDSAIVVLEKILELNKNSEYLFSENGRRIRSNAFNRRLTRVCEELHIKHRSMHKIRKTYGTTLLDAQVNESTVAEQMGHKDIATTKRYYYRSNKSDNTKFEQINRALSC